jgi:hypothetical protein
MDSAARTLAMEKCHEYGLSPASDLMLVENFH